VFRQQTFEILTRLYVVAGLSERERATSDGTRIRNLRQRNAECEDDSQ
jgi:hypothetical protein